MDEKPKNIIFQHTECLSKEELIDYLKKKLNKKEILKVEHHISNCEFCSDSIEGYINKENLKLDIYELKLKVLSKSSEAKLLNIDFNVKKLSYVFN